MKNFNISIDVGGTHTRLRAENIENGKIVFASLEYMRKINSKEELRSFITSSLNDIVSDIKPTHCVIGFAGAVIDHRKVKITNWKNTPTVILEDLIEWGLPENNTTMVNDMELAGYGILDMEDKDEMNSNQCEILYKPEFPAKNRVNNKLVIAPGTGFGTASIIEFITHSGEKVKNVLSSEIQHIQILAMDDRHAEIIEIMLSDKPERSFLNYEDFVSGNGLFETYEALLKLDRIEQKEKDASEIANSTMSGIDKYAIEALDIFYRCVGRITQAMALMIQPYGGIYLCGASTINNAKFIHQSSLMEELHNCLIRQQLLIQFPVYIITKSDINIAGGLWAGRNII
ncbi:MAG: glucokinase [Candidatus Cloacimonetes bacterium]|jgi:glucokinase|nr:glucokinase [Candidatus Cloacimonadota bacterium]